MNTRTPTLIASAFAVSACWRRGERRQQLSAPLSVWSLRAVLLVGLDEPEPLVRPARDLGEDVRAVGVVQLVRLLDADPRRPPELGQRVRQRGHVLVARRERQRIVDERGALGDRADGAL